MRSYTQHFDYITDFLWLEDNKQIVATRLGIVIHTWAQKVLTGNVYSGDGTLSVMDVRSKKTVPVGHSEDQEDELLSVVAIKRFVVSASPSVNRTQINCRATKVVVGTQLGILSVFNRDSGWGDCVDRIPGSVVKNLMFQTKILIL